MNKVNRRVALKGLGAFISLPYFESLAINKGKSERQD